MKKRIFCILTAALLLLSSCAQTTPDNGDDSQQGNTDYISVMWNSTDGFDHIGLSNGDNYAVSRLVFDSLFEINSSYEPVPLLAQSISYGQSACVVTLRQGIQFHGGNTLTADDVVYTANLHKSSPQSPYYSKLSNVSSITATATYTVVFNLKAPDGMFAAKLDFPILRNGSGKNSTDGTGRYIFKYGGSSSYLTKNHRYFDADATLVERINLVNATESTKVSIFNSGGLTLLALRENRFDTSIEKYYSAGTYLSNTLTYLVPNTENSALANAQVRKHISYAIDRAGILGNFSSTKAFITYSAINPSWYLYDASVVSTPTGKIENELSALGYKPNENGMYLSLNILVNNAVYEEYIIAKGMKSSLREIGIDVNIVSAGGTEYDSAVSKKSFDLRFASEKIPLDMDLSGVLYDNADIKPYIDALTAATESEKRVAAASALLKQLDMQTPIIPLYFTTVDYIARDDERGSIAPIPSSPLYGIWGMTKKT